MRWKLLQTIALAGVTAASSVVLADDSGLNIVVPMPPPTSRPSEADEFAVTDAETLFENVRRDASVARADLLKAQGELNRTTRILQSQLETNGALADASNEVAAAKAVLDELAQPILASLAEDPAYREARAALATAQQSADALRSRREADTEERLAAAQAVLTGKATVSKLEDTALDRNADVVKARKTYLAAEQRLKQTRLQLRQALRQDPAYVAARQAVDDARERVSAAGQKIAAARRDRFAAQKQLAAKQEARQQIEKWTYQHGLPHPP